MSKNRNIIIIIFIVYFLNSCVNSAPKITQNFTYARSGKVNYISTNKSLVVVSSEQSAENISKAVSFAEINALENILYRGIPGSPQENPIISDEVTSQKQSSAVLKVLVFEEGYKLFVTDSLPIETFEDKGMVTVIQKVTFDINALRKFLEKNEVIKKFGF